MNAEEKNRYFQELTLNLQREGFAVKPETEEGLLPVELDGQRLCLARASGAVRYRREDAADEHRSAALDSVISIAKTTPAPSPRVRTELRSANSMTCLRRTIPPASPARTSSRTDTTTPWWICSSRNFRSMRAVSTPRQ